MAARATEGIAIPYLNSNDRDFVEAPPPLFKWQGSDVEHEDNLKVIEAERRRWAVILPATKARSLRRELKSLNRQLKKLNADANLQRYRDLRREWHSLQLQAQLLETEHNELLANADNYPAEQLAGCLDDLRATMRGLRQQRTVINEQVQPLREQLTAARPLLQRKRVVRRKLQNHTTALDEKRKEDLLSKQMHQEAELVASTLSRVLARLGFRERITVGRRTKTKYVRFERVIATPDQLQFKLAATRRGMFGTVQLLPNDVSATDILTDSVMKELSMALEREVWSPQAEEDISFATGGWIVVERMGLYEGIPKRVSYRQLMARYETADHERIPIPTGLRKGRRINWTYLDSHASTHMMFTGITGSGKTNAVQAAISAVVEAQSPQDVLFVLIDLKNQGDFNELADAPHVLPHNGKAVVTEIPQVVELLKRVRSEMHWRQTRIGALAKNITSYNKRVKDEDRLPRIVIMFDEYANTRRTRFADEAATIDDICTEITQIGRASGIHLWLGIQQPRSSNMPQSLRDNFTTVFVGHQANIGAGQSVTGNRSSLKLPDLPGRMLCYAGWKQFEVQMPLISEDDINAAVQSANDAYGELTPYELHHNADGLDIEDDMPSDEEFILETAFTVFDGALKGRAIYEHIKPYMSYDAVREVIATLTAQDVIEFEGEQYTTQKQRGNFYTLEKASAEVIAG